MNRKSSTFKILNLDNFAKIKHHKTLQNSYRNVSHFDAKLIHTHTFAMKELETGLKYTKERIEDAIKVVVRNDQKLA